MDGEEFHADGADGADGGAPAPSPADERLSRFEQRLSQVTDAIGAMSRNQETQQIRSRISQRTAQVDNQLRSAERQVDAVEAELSDAYDTGDGATIAKTQRKLSEAIAAREHARVEKREHESALRDLERRQGGASGTPGTPQQQATQAKDTSNLDNWKQKHSSWYGVDAEMTKAAHEIDKTIREAGVIPVGSQQYFEAIDRQMTRRYPEQLRSTPDTASAGAQGGGQRPQGRPNTGRIPADVINGWRTMGIDVDNPETLQRMVGHRTTLADKGILPTQPAYGNVRTR